MRSRRDAGDRPPPTAGSWLHNYEMLTLGLRAISQGRDDKEPKGTEELKTATTRGRLRRKDYTAKVGSWRFRFHAPREWLRGARGVFSPKVSFIT